MFRRGYPRITTGGFPHSDIPGSKLDQQLPEAYRSRPRPSSAPGAKASTVCSSSLDSNREHHKPLWSFQGARGRNASAGLERRQPPRRAAGAGLSKLNSSAVGVDVFQASPAIRTALLPSRPGRPRRFGTAAFPRKEVIQPQLPLRLPCYDFTPITDSTFGRCLPRVGARTSGVSGFRGVTGGVYKARERIHRDVADSRLLATPTSWRRVSASNPNWDRLFGIRSTSRFCSPLYRPL